MNDSVGNVAVGVLEKQWSIVLEKLPGAISGEDPEDLHQARVATRRMRSAMRLFEPFLSLETNGFLTNLTELAAALGTVRDLDVQAEQIDEWRQECQPPAPVRLLRSLDLARSESRARLGELATPEPDLQPSESGHWPLAVVAPDLVARAQRRVCRAEADLDGAEPATYHRLRIRVKRLRYTLEFLAPHYEEAGPAAKRCVPLQDALGRMQDAAVAEEVLGQLEDPGDLGDYLDWHARKAREAKKQVPDLVDGLDGKAWRRLRRELRRTRETALGLR